MINIIDQLGIDKNIIYNSKIEHSSKNTDPLSFPISDKTVAVFIDGSALNNGKINCRAGYAALFPLYENFNISGVLKQNPTNNRAEYTACIKALEQMKLINPEGNLYLHIYTDSKLLVDSMTKWIFTWKKNNWKTANNTDVLNKDLLLILDSLLLERKVIWEHVKAHTGYQDFKSVWNQKADIAAKKTLQ